jgi:hypothetical protein
MWTPERPKALKAIKLRQGTAVRTLLGRAIKLSAKLLRRTTADARQTLLTAVLTETAYQSKIEEELFLAALTI